MRQPSWPARTARSPPGSRVRKINKIAIRIPVIELTMRRDWQKDLREIEGKLAVLAERQTQS